MYLVPDLLAPAARTATRSGRTSTTNGHPPETGVHRLFQDPHQRLTRAERTIASKSFSASGKLEVTPTRGWEQHPVLSQRDTGKSTLEDQLPALILSLEIDKAEADWARQEEERRSEIREERWKEVKREAFVQVAYQRDADRLVSDLARRDTAAAMRAYADEIAAHAAGLEASTR